VLDLVMKQLVPMDHRTALAVLARTPLALALSILAAMALHHFVELPGQRLLTRRASRRRQADVPAYPDERQEPRLVGAA